MKGLAENLNLRRSFMAICFAAMVCAPAVAGEPALAIRAKGYITADGKLVKNVTVLIEDGKITKIGKRVHPPKSAIVLDRKKSYIGPGLIEIHSSLGTMRRTAERANAVEMNADAADLFNEFHRDFSRAIEAGITTVVLAPSSSHFIGGVTSVVKTGGSDLDSRVVTAGPLKLSLTSQAFSQQRVPTSLQGGLAQLRGLIATARANQSDESAFAKWARGETVAFVDVDDAAAVSILAAFSKEQSVKCIALRGNESADRLDAAKALGQPVILGVYEFHDPFRYTRVPALLENAGIPVVLMSEPPRYAPELLRVGAAIAMTEGLSRKGALDAMTTTPAGILGLSDRIGSIEVGKEADIVLYDGDPLRLSSRVEEVFICGERVYSRASGLERSEDR